MAGLFSNFFESKEKHIVGVDIGSSSIKVVQLYLKKERVYLSTYGSVALGPYANTDIGRATNLSPDKIQKILSHIISESKITTKNAGVAMPFGSSLLSVIRMPRVSDEELENIIPMEARKYIPASLDEVTLDWSIISEYNNSSSEKETKDSNSKKEESKLSQVDILLAAVPNETINRYQSIVKNSGLGVSFMEIETFSTLRSTLRGKTPGSNVIIDIGARMTKIYIVDGGAVRSSHIINKGSQDITFSISKAFDLSVKEAEMVKRNINIYNSKGQEKEVISRSMDYIFSEVNRLLKNYQKKSNKPFNSVILTGGGGSLMGLEKISEEKLNIPVTKAKPFDGVEVPNFLKERIDMIGPEFSVACGVALRGLEKS